MKAIFFYKDYRKYLRDWAKATNMSYLDMERHFGMQKSSLNELIRLNNRCHPRLETLHYMAECMDLDFLETSYWCAMANYRKVKDDKVKKFYCKTMSNITWEWSAARHGK